MFDINIFYLFLTSKAGGLVPKLLKALLSNNFEDARKTTQIENLLFFGT